jgi:hypothetical protein
MNKKLFALIAIFCSLAFFISCSTDDNDTVIDEEWKAYNEKQVADIDKSVYRSRESESKNGTIYFKYIDFIAETTPKSTKITERGTPEYTDSVVVRYEARYYLKDGTPYIFKSTENEFNIQTGKGFRLSSSRLEAQGTYAFDGMNVTDGIATMLQHMHVGDEVEVCIPYQLGYGTNGAYYYIGESQYSISGYTTLWYKIKLLKIIR